MSTKRKKRILYHCIIGGAAGGSDTCLFLLVKYLDQTKYEPMINYMDKSFLTDELEKLSFKLIPLSNESNTTSQPDTNFKIERDNPAPQNLMFFKRLLLKFGNFGLLLINIKYIIKKMPETIKYAFIILRNRIDIVHANHYLTGDRSMILAAIILRRKVVSHNRGYYSPELVDKYLSKFIDQILCMSDFSKSVYTKSGIEESKCKTIYDGIDPESYRPSTAINEEIVIGCFGRLEVWKGQQVLVDAAEIIVKKIPEIKFQFVGYGENMDNIVNQVKTKNLEKYFDFTGHISNVKDYMEKCTVVVHTSIEPEPFGMVIIEAMALEKPVIATNIGGPLEIIENNKDGFLIPPSQPRFLAENILKLVENKELRESIGKNARQKVINKFNVRNYVKEIEKIYDEIIH